MSRDWCQVEKFRRRLAVDISENVRSCDVLSRRFRSPNQVVFLALNLLLIFIIHLTVWPGELLCDAEDVCHEMPARCLEEEHGHDFRDLWHMNEHVVRL